MNTLPDERTKRFVATLFLRRHIVAILAIASCGFTACTRQEVPTNPASSSRSSQSSPASSVPFVASRRLCSPSDLLPHAENNEAWSLSWKRDPAKTTITLDRPDQGFSVLIPYNPSWGSSDCQLSPFDETETVVTFGFAGIFEGGGAMRFNTITVKPARSAAEAIKALTAEQKLEREQGILPPGTEPKAITVNGKAAVRYFSGGLCDQSYVEVIGKKFNYVFSSTCNVDSAGIEASVESLKLY